MLRISGAVFLWCIINQNCAERYVGPKYHNLEQGVESRYCLHAAMAATTFYRSAPALDLRLAPLVLLRTGRRRSLPAGWTRIAWCHAIGGEHPHGSHILTAGRGSLAAARASESASTGQGAAQAPDGSDPFLLCDLPFGPQGPHQGRKENPYARVGQCVQQTLGERLTCISSLTRRTRSSAVRSWSDRA